MKLQSRSSTIAEVPARASDVPAAATGWPEFSSWDTAMRASSCAAAFLETWAHFPMSKEGAHVRGTPLSSLWNFCWKRSLIRTTTDAVASMSLLFTTSFPFSSSFSSHMRMSSSFGLNISRLSPSRTLCLAVTSVTAICSSLHMPTCAVSKMECALMCRSCSINLHCATTTASMCLLRTPSRCLASASLSAVRASSASCSQSVPATSGTQARMLAAKGSVASEVNRTAALAKWNAFDSASLTRFALKVSRVLSSST
mmetsp:Transcript_28564/g.54545  ORF Transcript_28564/g.54545 Transcript_28564/m.54545 type:complete len:256 (+) Transcript_28564:1302-2069(+)